jgi:hypothetical protein
MDMARRKKMKSYALEPDLLERLEAWRDSQEFPPTQTAVIEAALKEFLSKRDGKK